MNIDIQKSKTAEKPLKRFVGTGSDEQRPKPYGERFKKWDKPEQNRRQCEFTLNIYNRMWRKYNTPWVIDDKYKLSNHNANNAPTAAICVHTPSLVRVDLRDTSTPAILILTPSPVRVDGCDVPRRVELRQLSYFFFLTQNFSSVHSPSHSLLIDVFPAKPHCSSLHNCSYIWLIESLIICFLLVVQNQLDNYFFKTLFNDETLF